MSHEQTRRFRVNTILNTIEASSKAKTPVDKEKLIAESMNNFGSSRRTILEYIHALDGAGKIIEFCGEFYTPGLYEEFLAQHNSSAPGENSNKELNSNGQRSMEKLDQESDKLLEELEQ